jgi:hypothetical protein
MTLLALAVLALAGCKNDDDAFFHLENAADATAVNPEWNLTADEATRTFILKSDAAWAIVPLTGAADWVKFDPDHGDASDFSVISLNVAENILMEPRSAQFAIRQGNTEKFTIHIAQEAGIPLVWPKRGYQLLLETDAQQQLVTFSWDNPPASAAALLFSKNSDMSDPITVAATISGTSCTLTTAELQALQTLIENPTAGLKRYYRNELYWNVRLSNNALLSPEKGRMLYLSGQRTFTDVRGNETITYPVAVVENQYYKGIWMAANLKTKKDLNGDEGTNPSTIIYEAPADDDYSDYKEAGVMTPLENPNNGYYYRSDYEAPPLFIPENWKLPEQSEWEALWKAVAAVPGGVDVILDPVAYNNEAYGAWGLNLSVVGYFDTWPEIGVWHSGFYDDSKQYSPAVRYAQQTTTGWCSEFYYNFGSYNADFNFIPIRLKYTGDDE